MYYKNTGIINISVNSQIYCHNAVIMLLLICSKCQPVDDPVGSKREAV